MDVIMRVYIIPHDLANVQGQLRIRKKEILGPARRSLRKLLPRLIQDQTSWLEGTVPPDFSPRLIPNNKDRRSLAEIYGDLKSPNPAITIGWENVTGRLLDFSDDLSGFGMRSSLYNYQRRSVAAMIQRELDPADIPDPLFIPLQSMRGETFHLQPGTMEILRERPTTQASQSGILCEELGTGKTVMILALILATIEQQSSPEPSITDDRPVLTPISFRHFPSSECVSARKAFLRSGKDAVPAKEPRVPSLVELLLHRKRTSPDTRIHNTGSTYGAAREEKKQYWTARVEEIPQAELLKMNNPFYHHYPEIALCAERSPRTKTGVGPRVVYLTSATLIIVPSNLISQWDREIHKHCESALRVLILRSGSQIPDASSLASAYDATTGFTTENKYSNIRKLHSWKPCSCPCIPGSRIPDCKCKIPGVSPLLQIRWKRLVIDEGHVSASLSTILTPFVKMLSVERRWIVTGTPTRNLLGLSLGEKSAKDTRQQGDQDGSDTDSEDNNLNEDLPDLPSRSQMNIDCRPARVWTKHDREDLGKLGKMISHFIAVPQFIASPKLVTTHVIEPLLDPKGPRPGAIQVLNQVMETIMIRHRIDDIEREVVLPPMLQEAVLLDLDPYAVKSYNAMQAALAINAVDSQRIDQDYMFHPRVRNADALQTTIKNMSQVMFWSSDETLFGVDEMLKNSSAFIRIASKRKASPEDLQLLDEAVRHVKLAAEDPLWRAIQTHEDVPYRVNGLNRRLFEAWTRTPKPESRHNDCFVGFIHSDRLLKLQECVIQRPLISEDALITRGADVKAKDILLRRLYIESLKGKDRKLASKVRPHEDEINAGLKAEGAAKRARNPETLKEMKEDLDIAMTRLNDSVDDGEAPSSRNMDPSSNLPGENILSASLLGSVRIRSTASSKLNFLIDEVLRYAAEEKFLIFSDSELTLAHVAEALELIHIKFLRFTTQIDVRLREQMVLTFETSEKYRVFLMELKHGARGLNLISASRVIFCEPVWQADVESQAIKRAHRIGQTRAITVKTLAIRGTAEENMMTRRNFFRGNHEKVPKIIEDSGMRHYIANPKFITSSPEQSVTIDIPLLSVRPLDDADNQSVDIPSPMKRIKIVVDPVSPMMQDVSSEPPSKKQRRVVRFA
ncbi:hypothetical protein C0995_011026 [Termitomyces sp. Mi166|nr:hypothetical protein C0995_011026 [Termitomyces sp. Mi166\